MTVVEFARALRANVIVVIAITLLGAGLGAGAAAVQTPKYQSSAAVLVASQSPADVAEASQGADYAQQAAKSYAYIANTEIVLNRVIDRLGLRTSSETLAGQISASVPLDTQVVTITASDQSPVQAARIANGVAAALGESVDLLTPSLSASDNVVQVTTIQRAVPATSPVSPNIRLNIGLGALVGLVAGLIVVVLRERRASEGEDDVDEDRGDHGDENGNDLRREDTETVDESAARGAAPAVV